MIISLGKRPILFTTLLIIALTANACVDLSEVREFARRASEIGDRFPVLARDFFDSCMNQQRLIVAQKADFRVDKFGDLNDDNSPLLADGLELCKPFKDERPRLIRANRTLVVYMKTLGDLAANDLTSFDRSFADMGSALASAGILSGAASTAVTHLAAFITHIATEGYRRKQLKEVIKTANPDIQILTEALRRMVLQNYIAQLENEQVALKEYYRKMGRESVLFNRALVGNLPNGGDLSNPAPLDDMKDRYELKNAGINNRIAGAQAYAEVLKLTAEGHQKLTDNADKLKTRQFLREMASYAMTIGSLVDEFRAAF